VNRYLMRTGNAFSGAMLRQGGLEIALKVGTAGNRKGAKLRELARQC
jgi:hypothetical protein